MHSCDVLWPMKLVRSSLHSWKEIIQGDSPLQHCYAPDKAADFVDTPHALNSGQQQAYL